MSHSPTILSRKTSTDDLLLQTQDLATPSSSTPNSPGRRNTVGSDPSIELVTHTALKPPSRDGSPKIVLKRKEKTEATSKHTEEKVKHKASSKFEVQRKGSDSKPKSTATNFTNFGTVQMPISLLKGSSISMRDILVIQQLNYWQNLTANLTEKFFEEARRTVTLKQDLKNLTGLKSGINAALDMVEHNVAPQFFQFSKPKIEWFFTIRNPGIPESVIQEIKEIFQENILRLLTVDITVEGYVSFDEKTKKIIIDAAKKFSEAFIEFKDQSGISIRTFKELEKLTHESIEIEKRLSALEALIQKKHQELQKETEDSNPKNTQEAVEGAFYVKIGHEKLDATSREIYINQGVELLTQEEFKKIMFPNITGEAPTDFQDFISQAYRKNIIIAEVDKPIPMKTAREIIFEIKKKIMERLRTNDTPPKIPFGADTIEVIILQALNLKILTDSEIKKIFHKHKVKFNSDIPPVQTILKALNPNYPYKKLLVALKIRIYERAMGKNLDELKFTFQSPIRSIIAAANTSNLLELQDTNEIFTTYETPKIAQEDILRGHTPQQSNFFANLHSNGINQHASVLKTYLRIFICYIQSQIQHIDILLHEKSDVYRLIKSNVSDKNQRSIYITELRDRLMKVMIKNYLDPILISIGRQFLIVKENQLHTPFLAPNVLDEFESIITQVDSGRGNVLTGFLEFVGKGHIAVMDTDLQLPPLNRDPLYPNLSISVWIEKALSVFGKFLCKNKTFLKDLTRFITIFAKYAQEHKIDFDKIFPDLQTNLSTDSDTKKPKDPTEEIRAAILDIFKTQDQQQQLLAALMKSDKEEDKAYLEKATEQVLNEHAANYTFLASILENKKCLPEGLKKLFTDVLTDYNSRYKKVLKKHSLDQILGGLIVLYSTPRKDSIIGPLRSITLGCGLIFDPIATPQSYYKTPENTSDLLLKEGEFIIVEASSANRSMKIRYFKEIGKEKKRSPRGPITPEVALLQEVCVEFPISDLTTSKRTLPKDAVKSDLKIYAKIPEGSEELPLEEMRRIELFLKMAMYDRTVQIIEIANHQTYSFSETSQSSEEGTETDAED